MPVALHNLPFFALAFIAGGALPALAFAPYLSPGAAVALLSGGPWKGIFHCRFIERVAYA